MTDLPPLAARHTSLDIPRRQWLLLLGLFLLSLPAVTTRIYSSDEIQYFAYLRSAWFDRDLSFENEYRYFYDRGIARSDGFHETFLERRTETGRRINFATIGCAILWAPFYAAGDAIARASGAPADGFSRPYVAAVAYGSAVYGFLAIVLAMLAASRLGLQGLAGAIAIWLGTPLLFYMYVAPPFSHACSAFAVALFIYVWLRVRRDWSARGLVALGAAAALMAMVREQDGFFAFGAALDFLWTQARIARAEGWRRQTGAWIGAGAGIVGFAVVFAPQAATYLILNGHLGPHSSVGRKMNWASPHALQVLFSPEHGFFVWTPLALLALAGLLFVPLFVPPEGGSYRRDGGPADGGSLARENGQADGGSLARENGQADGGSLARENGQADGGSHARDRGPADAGSVARDRGPAGGGRPVRVSAPVQRGGGSWEPASVVSGFSRKRQAAVCLMLMVLLQVYIGGSVESWTVAGAFGQRRFIALTAAMVIGYAAMHGAVRAASSHAGRLLVVITVLAVYWNLALTAEFATGLMDRQRLEPRKNAYDAFVTLPAQAPSLIYRYLFDRSSFYRPAVEDGR